MYPLRALHLIPLPHSWTQIEIILEADKEVNLHGLRLCLNERERALLPPLLKRKAAVAFWCVKLTKFARTFRYVLDANWGRFECYNGLLR